MKKINSFLFTLVILVTSFLLLPSSNVVYAQDDESDGVLCDFIPFLNDIPVVNDVICLEDASAAGDAVSNTVQLIQFGISLVFIGIIAVAVYVIIKAAIKYIRSEGEEEKVQEAQKAIKQVFAGIVALFVGLIGLVILIAVFGATGALNPEGDDPFGGNEVLDPLTPNN